MAWRELVLRGNEALRAAIELDSFKLGEWELRALKEVVMIVGGESED
jgi:hypothetical protein